MRYYRNDGNYISTIGLIDGAEEITESEFLAEMSRVNSEKTYDQEVPDPEPTPEERLTALEEQQERTDAAVQELILSALGGE